jgi:hypothetical protein
MALKLLRSIRLDPSDTFVFANAAEPGEWCVPGGFRFIGVETAGLDGRARQAFRSSFLGLASFGATTLATAVEATPEDRAAAVAALARHLVEAHGAPDETVARAAAEEEVDFAASLADHPPGTLVALHRTEEDGALRERFRTLKPGPGQPADLTSGRFRAFQFVESVGEDDVEEAIDLMRLGQDR